MYLTNYYFFMTSANQFLARHVQLRLSIFCCKIPHSRKEHVNLSLQTSIWKSCPLDYNSQDIFKIPHSWKEHVHLSLQTSVWKKLSFGLQFLGYLQVS